MRLCTDCCVIRDVLRLQFWGNTEIRVAVESEGQLVELRELRLRPEWVTDQAYREQFCTDRYDVMDMLETAGTLVRTNRLDRML